MSAPSRTVLRDLTATRYVANYAEEDRLETARAGCSSLPPQPNINHDVIIEGHGEDVELVEDENYCSVHRIDETPKLVDKKPSKTIIRDEAVKVLRHIQTVPIENLRLKRYDYFSQRWFHTTRESEKALVEHVFLHPNQRPHYFAAQCRKLSVEDISSLILTSLLTEPKETGQNVARFAIQTTNEMSFQTLFALLEQLEKENERFQMTDSFVVATLIRSQTKRTITRLLRTTHCREYGNLEPGLDSQGRLMTSTASITCSIRGKRHVETRIVYKNNSSTRDPFRRNRYIELEQTVKCMNRRVLIVEEPVEIHEFEVEKDMISLENGIAPVDDLISFLETFELDEEDE
ncbi:MEiosis-to-MItosis transition associated [Caenorhabditis elegans]|uniref:MEiosis-to-MItosis transition associated n=1 Tax=Caenorhabditis elegans TaxID=6239 RepID=Q9N575_CAEEL|nr:MEiosis-to-MItosis transition associated [Caenorhabditis elegans]CCD68716.1 MEiosis-to-MItosis transition associated [Caenorhabditis elegans]|eukprot:NP_500636.1 MEiosis-to-MItosis transition associated [Caenorhabditis elegans]